MARPNMRVGLDPADRKYQMLVIGDGPPIRLGLAQAQSLHAALGKNLPEQKRHAEGARIMLPGRVERLA